MPAAWDNTMLIEGYPGENIILRRDKGDTIYIAGLNGTDHEYICQYNLDFLSDNSVYKMLLIADGLKNNQMAVSYSIIDTHVISQRCLPMGGFSVRITKFVDADFDDLLVKAERIYNEGITATGIQIGAYDESEVIKLGYAIEKAKSSQGRLQDKFNALATAYSEFCNKGRIISH